MVDARPAALDDELLTVQEVADRLKVHYMTAYRWIRRGDLPAFKAGGRLRVRRADLDQFTRRREVEVALPAAGPSRRDWAIHSERLHECLLQGQSLAAGHLVDKVVADGATATDVYTQLITPVMYRVGEDWAQARIGIAVEHRATEIASRLIAGLGGSFRRRGPSLGTALTITPAGEQHALGLAMVADYLRGLGYEVHHLGSGVPGFDLARFLEAARVDVVCVSVTNPQYAGEACAHVVKICREVAGALVVVGGLGADQATVEDAGGLYAAGLPQLGSLLARARRGLPPS